MENNEIVNVENFEIMDEVVMEDKPGLSTGGAILFGAGLTLAVGAGIKLVKKLIANAKAKKELRCPDHEVLVEDEDIDEVVAK